MARLLRVRPQVKIPVRVCWGSFKHFADTSLDEKAQEFVIRLSRQRIKTRAELEDTLMHEYAHVLAWFSAPTHHGPEWGVAFARLYRFFYRVS
jgi:hypothetical protein